MGVRGLWKVLEPAGRPVSSPEALAGQRVAIDASIWIYQFLRVVPPGGGASQLILSGIFRRLCKLLYFGVKPVMVFDGTAPTLKRTTTRERAARRGQAEERYRRIARKIIAARLHVDTLRGATASDAPREPAPHVHYDADTFENIGRDHGSVDESDEKGWDFDPDYLETLDASSKEFRSLPGDLQQQLLWAKKEYIFQQHAGLCHRESRRIEALRFSNMQVEALVKRRRVAEQLERTREGAALDFEKDYLARQDSLVSGKRIASEAGRRYVLVKKRRDQGGGWLIDATTTGSRDDDPKDHSDEPHQREEADEFDELFGTLPPEADVNDHDLGSVVVLDSLIEQAQQKDTIKELSFNPEAYLEPGASRDVTVHIVSDLEDPEVALDNGPGLFDYQAKSEEAMPSPLTPLTAADEVLVLDAADEHIKADHAVDRAGEDTQDIGYDPEDAELVEDMCAELAESGTSVGAVEERNKLIDRLQAEIHSLRESSSNPSHSTTVDNELLEDFRVMLTCMGIPWMTAPGEAEAQCAWLQAEGHVDSVITDDNDVFLFGATRVYRHFFNNRQRISLFLGRDIERELSLDRGLLVVLALLLGSDYCVGVRGMGPVRSLQLIKALRSTLGEDSSPEAWIDTLAMGLVDGTWPPTEDPSASALLSKLAIQCALPDATCLDRSVLTAYLQPPIDETDPHFSWHMLSDLTAVQSFLKHRLGWSDEECRRTIDSLVLRQLKRPPGSKRAGA